MPKYDYIITAHDLQIRDSYKYSKHDFADILVDASIKNPDCQVWRRGPKSLRREWAVHNLCYNLHIRRAQTKDVDLDYPCDGDPTGKREKLYNFLGAIAWVFIK